MSDLRTVQLFPVLSVPKRARPAATYLVSVDLVHDHPPQGWPYDTEEITLTCLLETLPLFRHQPLGDGTLIVHRFGGSYGPAKFILTAADTPTTGSIGISFIDEHGVPIHHLRVPDVNVSLEPGVGPKASLPRLRRQVARARAVSRAPDLPEEQEPQAAPTSPVPAIPPIELDAVPAPVLPVPESPAPAPQPTATAELAAAFASATHPEEYLAESDWYVGIDGRPVGPVTLSDLRAKFEQQQVTLQSLVWQDGLEEWIPLRSKPALVSALTGAALPAVPQPAPSPPSQLTGSVRFICPSCNAKYQISRQALGGKTRRMKCRRCSFVIQIFDSPVAEATKAQVAAPAVPRKTLAPAELATLENEELLADDSWFSRRAGRVRVLREAQRRLDRGEHAAALIEYQKLVAKNPHDVRIWLLMGDVEASRNNHSGALFDYNKAAQHYWGTEELMKAAAVYERMFDIIRHVPNLASAYANVGPRVVELLSGAGRVVDAVLILEELAGRLEHVGEYKSLLAVRAKLVQLVPDDAMRRAQLATLLSRDGAMPDNVAAAKALRIAADSFTQRGEAWQATQLLERSLALDAHPRTARQLAALFVDRGTLQDARLAVATLRPFGERNILDLEALGVLLGAFLLLGDVEKAEAVRAAIAGARSHSEIKLEHAIFRL